MLVQCEVQLFGCVGCDNACTIHTVDHASKDNFLRISVCISVSIYMCKYVCSRAEEGGREEWRAVYLRHANVPVQELRTGAVHVAQRPDLARVRYAEGHFPADLLAVQLRGIHKLEQGTVQFRHLEDIWGYYGSS
jgi:hypothetical protein